MSESIRNSSSVICIDGPDFCPDDFKDKPQLFGDLCFRISELVKEHGPILEYKVHKIQDKDVGYCCDIFYIKLWFAKSQSRVAEFA